MRPRKLESPSRERRRREFRNGIEHETLADKRFGASPAAGGTEGSPSLGRTARVGEAPPFHSVMSPRRELCQRLESQMQQWGQDVRSPVGNLLVRHGFIRWCQREQHKGSSRYRLSWRDRVVELHGFCAGLYGGGRPGFIYIRANNQVRVYLGGEPPIPGKYASHLLASDLDPRWKSAFAAARDEFLTWVEQYRVWRHQLFNLEAGR